MDTITLYAVGDVLVNRQAPESILALAKPVLDRADLRFCQLEAIYTREGEGANNPTWKGAGGAHRVPPGNAAALKFGDFNVVSMASNHCLDWGFEGMLKTMEAAQQNGALVVGAGKNIEEARKPAILERKGVKVGFLAYNSILLANYWATEDRPGCAPLRAFTMYEPYEYDQPGQPCRVHTFCHGGDLAAMKADIEKLRGQVDVLAVSLHYGLHFIPAKLADYQKEASYAAIDAGADVVLGHHAHILKGIQVYKGKAIFYGLCNFALDSFFRGWPNITPRLRELVELYGWKIEPEWGKYPHHPDARKTIIARCVLSKRGVEKVSFLPVMINKEAQPEVLTAADKRSAEVVEYMRYICQDQGLKTELVREGDEVVVRV